MTRLVVLASFLAATSTAQARNAPEISRSTGVRGGVVVLWPRVIPRSERESSRAVARAIQAKLVALVGDAVPGRPVDVRPEPERVCPRQGCKAMSAGALLIRKENKCVVLGLVSRWGKAPFTMIPWIGKVTLAKEVVPFREPPESEVTIVDWVPCDQVETQLGSARTALIRALWAATS